ncbi:suppressor of tumorigenicity 14 protein-like isoform X3 [Zootermopsis nevadensis]|uniref:suppressor of tumorigenicity 14 protein-like isoform X3 n=1 Tax=Zootermopsis nevadensis TaxID=136037 RepID=UPI000B8EAB3A|nr:suppressor of tumorigenicity 14 protein-like isoform X3 [Zootermopsis nevadensis]
MLWISLVVMLSALRSRHVGVGGNTLRNNTLQRTGCYIRLETPEGFLDSPSYPDSYPPGFDCCYDIARLSSHHCGVKFYAEQLTIVKTPEDGDFCQTDWLSVDSCVPEGGSRFCGNLTGSACSRALRLIFHSSQQNPEDRPDPSVKYRYRLRYQILNDCGGLFQEPAVSDIPGEEGMTCYTRIPDKRGSIHTPFYPEYYSHNLDCVYEFIRPNPFICGIRMRSVEFQLEPSTSTPFGGACADYLQAPGCGFLCGFMNFSWTAVYQPGATGQRFHFHSDEANSHQGFLIAFEQVYHC